METQEANKIIAEYMGNTSPVPVNIDDLSERQKAIYQPYMSSLDALIPAWEKLKEKGVWINKMGNRKYFHFSFFSDKPVDQYKTFDPYFFCESISESTIQEAACIATAKAIKELK